MKHQTAYTCVICTMKRDEAISFLKEITTVCSAMTPDAVTLCISEINDLNAVGYQVHIKTVLDSKTRQQIEGIAKKHCLVLKEEHDEVVIYRPREPVKAD